MNGSLIDTNVIIKLLKGDEEAVLVFDELKEVFISVIVIGELYYGAFKSTRSEENIKLFKDFVSEFTVLDIDLETSETYGKVKKELILKGINIPENDL